MLPIDEQITAPSTVETTEQVQVEAPELKPIEDFSPEERHEWLKTGKIPEAPEITPKTAEPEPAAEPKAEEKPPEAELAPESAPEVKQEEPKAKSRKTAEDRNKELAAQIQESLKTRADLRREIDELRKERESAAPTVAKTEPIKPVTAPTTLEKPKPPSLDTWEGTLEEFEAARAEYSDKLIDWKLAEKERSEQLRKDQQEFEGESRQYAERAREYLKERPDYPIAEQYARDFLGAVGNAVVRQVMRSPVGPQIIFHLFENDQAEALRIAKTGDPVAVAYEIGKIEAALSGKRAPAASGSPVKKVSNAAPPPTELSAAKSAPGDEADAALASGDFATYKRIMNARERQRRN